MGRINPQLAFVFAKLTAGKRAFFYMAGDY
jgi:hypothetical protein